MSLLKKVPALMLLTGSVYLLQTHAMDYWGRHDEATGWLWSIVIEGAAIWLWANGRSLLGFIATLLALSAPLYQLAAPLLEHQQQQANASATLPEREQTLRQTIASLEASLVVYNSNSQTRGGWAARIDQAQQRLAKARNELSALQNEAIQPVTEAWQSRLQIGTQALALVLMQILVVLTTRTVFAPLPTAQQRTQTAAPAAGEHPGLGWAKVSRLFHLEKRHATPKNQRLTGVA